MGCTPTAQRLNSIPSCNVNASTKSTKSTLKNSDHMLSPQKLPHYRQKSDKKLKLKRYYSPKYVPTVKVTQENAKNTKKKGKNMSKQKQGRKNQHLKQNMQVKNLDIVSHLSLNSQYNPKQNLHFLEYEARTPQKKRQQIEIESKKSSNRKNSQQTQQKSHTSRRKFYRQPSHECYILEKELRNMNTEQFEKIKIDNRNF